MIIDHPRAEDILGLRHLWKEAFSDTDDFLDTFFDTGFCPERAMTVKEGEEVLAALYWFDCLWEEKQLAYIYAVATRKKNRGQGLCHKLMEAAHTCLQEKYHGAVLVPADEDLRKFYERFGYRSFGGRQELQISAGENGEALTEISAEQYSAVRRHLLPVGSVLQEGNTLPFLQTQLQFFAGEGWCAAGRKEEQAWVFPEFLGTERVLPAVLRTLGAERATAFFPGQTRFAMYHSLQGEEQMPAYFAFALD